jgi:hypothetical protein
VRPSRRPRRPERRTGIYLRRRERRYYLRRRPERRAAVVPAPLRKQGKVGVVGASCGRGFFGQGVAPDLRLEWRRRAPVRDDSEGRRCRPAKAGRSRATIDREHGAVGVGGAWAGQDGDRGGDFPRLARSPNGMAAVSSRQRSALPNSVAVMRARLPVSLRSMPI